MFRRIIFFFLMIIVFSVAPTLAFSDENHDKPRQVIFVIDKLSLTEIDKNIMPNLIKLQGLGSIGLMNTNTSGPKEPANTYMAIANGQRTKGGDWAGRFFHVSEYVYTGQTGYAAERQQAGSLYYSLTGWRSGNAAIVNPGIANIINYNSDLKYGALVGNLGEHLKTAGISRAVVGNSDTFAPRRFAAALVMDQKGTLPQGYIDSTTNQGDPSFPNGIRTDYDRLFTKTSELMKNGDLVVIELGDLSRLEEVRSLMTANRYAKLRLTSLQRIDRFIGELMALLDLSKDQAMVLVPTPSVIDINNDNRVTPLIISGNKFKPDSLLTSPSTRRQGLITNTDVAPTVLAFYGINKTTLMDGRPISSGDSGDSLAFIKKANERLVLIYQQRPPLLTAMAVLEIIAIICSLLVIRFGRSHLWHMFQRISLVFLILPLVMLFYKFIQLPVFYLSAVAVIVVVIAAVTIAEHFSSGITGKIAVISLLTSFAIIADLLTGASLIISSPLGYDGMVGARYYGLGNEFSGILMGSTLLGLAALAQRGQFNQQAKLWKIIFALYLFGVTVVLFTPQLGADAGGVITASISFIYFMFLMCGKEMTTRRVVLICSAVLSILFGGAVTDHFINGAAQSHIGLAMWQVIQGGWAEALHIIERKLLMNWKLMQFSVWSKVLLATIAGLTFFTYYPKGIFRTIEREHIYIFKGVKAIILAAIVGFIVNDSGVVQAATTVIYVIFPLIYLVLLRAPGK